MRFLIIATLLTGCLFSIAPYSGVVTNNLTKAKQFKIAKLWISSLTTSYKTIIDLEDRENGLLMANVSVYYTATKPASYEHTKLRIKLVIKENRYKYEIKILKHSAMTGYGTKEWSYGDFSYRPKVHRRFLPMYEKARKMTIIKCKTLVISLKEDLSNQPESGTDSW